MCPPGSPVRRRTRVRDRPPEPAVAVEQRVMAADSVQVQTVRQTQVAQQARRGSQLSNRATEALMQRLRARAAEVQVEAETDQAVLTSEDQIETQEDPAPTRETVEAVQQQTETEQQATQEADQQGPETGVEEDTQTEGQIATTEVPTPTSTTSETATEPFAPPDQTQTAPEIAQAPQTGVEDAEAPPTEESAPAEGGTATQAAPTETGAATTGPDAEADPAPDPLTSDAGAADGAQVDAALTPGPELQAWHARTVGAADSIETPALTRAPAAAAAVRAQGFTMRGGRSRRRETIDEEASAAVTEPPKPADPPSTPPPDPKPGANKLVEVTADRPLADAQMPDLNTSPRGTQPLVRDPGARRPAPEPTPAEQTSTEPTESATSSAETAPTDSDLAATEAVSEAANGPVPELPPGTAEGVTIQDTPPPPREPLPPNVGNIMRDVIARLLVNTRSQAEPILTAARQEAYPNQVLPRVYNDIGDDKLDGLTDTLTEALRLVAADAGIAADQLNAAVDARRAEVETAADAADGELETAGTDEAETMSEESGEEVAEVNAAEDAQHARTTATVQAATGEGSPQVIDARRDAQLRKINRRVANIRFDYDRTKDRRHAALDRAMVPQSRAYDQTATEDQAAIDAESEGQKDGGFVRSLQKARIRNWANQEKRDLGTEVRRLKGVATTKINGYRDATFSAGQTASGQVRDWATTQKGETTSWWDRLWALFTDWSQQAEVEAENWSVVRAGEARDATVQNMSVLAGFIQTQGQDINLETNEALNGLSAEQQAVIRAYYASPAGNRDTIGAVAAGLKFRLAAQQKRPLIDALKTEVMGKPDSDAENLERIGIAQTSGFSAERIADRLYDAMFGGVTGWGTDEDKIYTNLSGLTALQGRAVRAMYKLSDYGDLDSDLASELDSDNALVRARAALNGDPVMETVGALNEAMSGWGTDEDTIMRMLRGKTAEQRAQIAEEYQRRYGVDLNAALDSEMDDHDQDRAEALLAGDTSRADAIALDQAMHGGFLGWGTDEEQIESVYGDIRNDVAGQQVRDGQGGMRPMDQEEMEAEVARRNLQVEASYNVEYGSPGDQDSALRAAYRDELSGPDLDLANALADNDLVAADAARLERERRGFYTDDDVVNGVLENQYGRALEGLRRSNEFRDRREQLLKTARERSWNSYQLAAAQRALDREMEDRAREGGAANMAALEAKYDTRYSRWGSGGLQVMIAFNMSGTDREKARSLLDQGGYLSPAQRIDYATRGVGTDEAEFERAIAGRTAAEIDEIDAELDAMDPPRDTTRQLAASELSGRDEFDMNMRLQGVPENAEQEMAQARERAEWELNNSVVGSQTGVMLGVAFGGPLGGALMGSGEHQRRVLRQRLSRMQAQYDLINDPDADPFERQRALDQFRARGTGIQSGVESYRAQVDAVTDAAATAAALTAAITVTVLTGGVAGAVLGALAAAAATISVKAALKGAAYGVEDMAVDAVVGIVDAAAAYATFGMGNALLRLATSQGGRMSRLGGTRLATSLARMAGSSSRTQRMMAHGVAEMIEGAAGALPSALTGNMLNDKNWERGNPLTNILGGTLMETGMGGLMGGGMGSLGGFRAPRVDPPTPRTGDILAHRGKPQDRADAWRSFRAENPEANMRDFLRRYDDQVADRLAAEARDADVQRALRTELLSGIPPRQRGQFRDMNIEVMSDADFKAFTKSDSANAVTLIENGQPRVILRDGAPPGVLREEGIHLQQIADPDLGRLARRLDEGRLRDWDSLSLGEQLELYSIKVELEIDAQIRLIDGLDADIRRSGPGVDIDALQRQRDIAQDSLGNLRRRADEVASLGPMDRIAMSRGLRDPPPYLDQPARLFQKTSKPKTSDVGDQLDTSQAGPPVTNSPLNVGRPDTDRVQIVSGPSTVPREIELTKKGRITATREVDGALEQVELEVFRGRLFYSGPPRTAVSKGTPFVAGEDVPAFTYLGGRKIEVQRRVRTVEVIRSEDGVSRLVAIQKETNAVSSATLKEMGWRERGTRTSGKGAAGELASRRLSARRAADPESDVIAVFDVQRPDGTGFDTVEVRRGADGEPVLTLVEVKNYAENYVSFESFTAILFRTRQTPGNLQANLMDLEQRLRPSLEIVDAAQAKVSKDMPELTPEEIARLGPDGLARRAEARLVDEIDRAMARKLGVSPEAYRMALHAIQDLRLEALIRLGPDTLLGRTGPRNALNRLRRHWSRLKDKLKNFARGASPDIRGLRDEVLDRTEFEEAQAAVRGLQKLRDKGFSGASKLRLSNVEGARYVSDDGKYIDVMPVNVAEASQDITGLAARINDRLTTRLENGQDLHLVVDLSDITINKAQLEAELLSELRSLGLSEEALERLVVLRVRI